MALIEGDLDTTQQYFTHSQKKQGVSEAEANFTGSSQNNATSR